MHYPITIHPIEAVIALVCWLFLYYFITANPLAVPLSLGEKIVFWCGLVILFLVLAVSSIVLYSQWSFAQ